MKKIYKKNISFLILSLAIGVQFSWASSSSVGTTGAQFLKVGVGGRPMGMGGAYAAVAGDVNSLYFNPAGLNSLKKMEIQAQHISWFDNIVYESLAAALSVNNSITVGIAISYQDIGSIESRSGDTEAPDGSYGADDKLLNFGLSKKINDQLSFGANAKYIQLTLESKKAKTWGVDFGSYYQLNNKLSFAAVMQNIGEEIKFVSEGDPLPLNFKWGVAYKTLKDKLLIAFDTNHPNDNYMNSVLGLEYNLEFPGDINLPLRLGYKTLNDFDTIDSFSAGVGIEFQKRMSLDIAWVPYGDLGDTYRISLKMDFD